LYWNICILPFKKPELGVWLHILRLFVSVFLLL